LALNRQRPETPLRFLRPLLLWHNTGFLIATVLLLAFLCTLPALKNRFCGDDLGLIVNNPQLAASPPLPLLTRSFASGALAAHRLPVSYYRPLTSISFWLDRHLWGLRPLPYHLDNLLLNLACVALAFLILNLLLASPIAAALGSLLFAVHPMHAESIAYVSGRTDLLMTAFALAAFYLLLLARRRLERRLVVLAFICYALALLAKETAVMFPFFLLVWFVSAELSRGHLGNRESWPLGRLTWPVFAALLVITAGYLFTRAGILGPGLRLTPDVRVAQYPALMLDTLGLYFRLFLFPFHHQPYYPFREDFLSVNGYGAFALGIALLTLVAVRFRTRTDAPVPPGSAPATKSADALSAGLGLWLALLFLLPVLNLLFLSGPIAAERFLYLPSFGMILLVAAIVRRFVRARSRLSVAAIAVSLALTVLLAINLLMTLSTWRDDLALSRAMVRATPDFAMAHNSLGVALKEQGQIAAAEPEFARAINLKPDYAEAHNNLGATRDALGDRNSALAEYRLAVGYDSTYVVARNNLGAALGALGEPDSAIIEFQAALRLDPGDAEAHNNLGVAYYSQGRKELARQEFSSALKLRPDYVRALVNLARLELADSSREAARDLLSRARRIAPGDRQVQALLPALSR
jgi:Flp pilus assembly protein TadD